VTRPPLGRNGQTRVDGVVRGYHLDGARTGYLVSRGSSMSSLEGQSVDSTTGDRPTHGPLNHLALLYTSVPEYFDAVISFVVEGLAAGEPVMVALPGSKADRIRAQLKDRRTYFVDMAELGRNPGRIIPAVHEFLQQHRGRPSRFVGEPIWPGRSADEIAEATRHEALINVSLAEAPVTILCPYDCIALPGRVIDDSWRTHPEIIRGGLSEESLAYENPDEVYSDQAWPLSPPPPGVDVRHFGSESDLSNMRSWVEDLGWAAGLDVDRVDDLVLAVSEVAGNSVRHGGGAGTIAVWRGDGEDTVVCEIRDGGHIADPLVGRHAPGPDLDVNGLWLVNQLCDLVEIRSGLDGTQVRLTVAPLL
jgi:anti-sigma regulatory factor (Ser/Thr protein kinase)